MLVLHTPLTGAHGACVEFGLGRRASGGGLALPAAAVVGAMLLGTPADSRRSWCFASVPFLDRTRRAARLL